MKKSRICNLLGIEHPIILGAMGRISTGELAAAVSNAGGLGSVATMMMTTDQVKQEIQKCRSLTNKPFAVNVPVALKDAEHVLDVVLDLGVGIVSTSAGPPDKLIPRLKAAGVKTMHVVANVSGALRAERAGVDIVIAEGTESGGMASRDEVATLVLIPQVVDAVKVPVVAAGGIADGRGFLAALALGAEGVQLGTAFLATTECRQVSQTYKDVLINATDVATAIAARRVGPMRMVKNKFYEVIEALDRDNNRDEIQALMRSRQPISQDDPQNGMYAFGQVAGLIREIKAVKELIDGIIREAEEIYRSLA